MISGEFAADFDGQLGGTAGSSYSTYESSATSYGAAPEHVLNASGFGASSSSNYESNYEQQGFANAAAASGAEYNASSFEQSSGAAATTTTYATDAQGLFKDPNPEVIRRPAAGGLQTFTQRVMVRFLQPPPVPPPGVSTKRTANIFQTGFRFSRSSSKKFVHHNHHHHHLSIFVRTINMSSLHISLFV